MISTSPTIKNGISKNVSCTNRPIITHIILHYPEIRTLTHRANLSRAFVYIGFSHSCSIYLLAYNHKHLLALFQLKNMSDDMIILRINIIIIVVRMVHLDISVTNM